MKNNKPCILIAGFFITFIFLLLSCGIYDYPYIYPVPEGNRIRSETNTFISINTGNDNYTNSYFTHFIIFYRIYISNNGSINVQSSAATGLMNDINATMASDHTRINNISGSQSVGGATAYNLITNTLRFNEIALNGINIDNVLSDSAIGTVIAINFPHNTNPYLAINGNIYTFIRPHISLDSNERFFRNNPAQLLNDINNIDGINRDVQNNRPEQAKDFSYALMYIMACGMNTQTYVPIYSSPTFLGVLLLPD